MKLIERLKKQKMGLTFTALNNKALTDTVRALIELSLLQQNRIEELEEQIQDLRQGTGEMLINEGDY